MKYRSTLSRTLPWQVSRLLAYLVVAYLCAACTPKSVRSLIASPPASLPLSFQIPDVPFTAQTQSFCGPATIAMALEFYGETADIDELAKAVYVPELGGSLQAEISALLRRKGMLAYPLPNNLTALLQELAAGHPVIVLQNLGLKIHPVWHYALVIGYDLNSQDVILHTGKQQTHRLALKTFAYTWARSNNWALVPLPVGSLPWQNDPNGTFIAAVDLSKTFNNQDSTLAMYQSILKRWPAYLPGSIALSNMLEADSQHEGSTTVLMQALAYKPQSAVLYNNLAFSLMSQECYASARDAIDCAVKVDADPAYRQSKMEIDAVTKVGNRGLMCPQIECVN